MNARCLLAIAIVATGPLYARGLDEKDAAAPAAQDRSQATVRASGGKAARTLADRFGEAITVKDFGAVGDGRADDTDALQAALSSGRARVFVPRGTYRVTRELLVDQRHGLKIVGDGVTATSIRYEGPRTDTGAIIKLRRSSYCRLEDLTLTSQAGHSDAVGTALAAFGVYITSDGSGLTQFNTLRHVAVRHTSVAGVQIGNTGAPGTDTNVDGNVVEESLISHTGTGVRVFQTNTNLTKISGGAISENSASGIEIGKNARGVVVERVLGFLNGAQFILVGRWNSGPIALRDMVTELYQEAWLRVEGSAGGVTNKSLISIEGVNVTNNNPNPSVPVIDYGGIGTVTIRNSRFGGGRSVSGGRGAALAFAPVNGRAGGTGVLITEGVELYDGAHWEVATEQTIAWMRWFDWGTTTSGQDAGTGTTGGAALRLKGRSGQPAATALEVAGPVVATKFQAESGAGGVPGPVVSFGTAPPATGTWTRGSRVLNSQAAPGEPKGWVCTASGTPGTWMSEGAL